MVKSNILPPFDKRIWQRNYWEHIKHAFEKGELSEKSVVRNFRITASDRKSYDVQFYNLDASIQLNGWELLAHAGKISHQLALDKSTQEYEKIQRDSKTDST